ncbi:hypothetical protein U9M48_029825 [Paspalum notatum var. saurae]|uniref:Uncharacterized protein n=1 Tax=Paspalum notatum var. saurae TaxID=547442 RepID=A0AAQ3X2N1_PASNO
MDDRRAPILATLGLGTLAFNSALAVYNSWGDTGSVVFVLAADAALLLLFLCLRRLEGQAGELDVWTKAAVCGAHHAAHGDVRLQGRAADAAARGRGGLGHGRRNGCRGLLGILSAESMSPPS